MNSASPARIRFNVRSFFSLSDNVRGLGSDDVQRLALRRVDQVAVQWIADPHRAAGGRFAVSRMRMRLPFMIEAPLRVLILLLLTSCFDLSLRFVQQPCVVFGMLREVFRCDSVASQQRVPGQCQVFFYDLLRVASYFALGSSAFEDPIDDVPWGSPARLVPRARLVW